MGAAGGLIHPILIRLCHIETCVSSVVSCSCSLWPRVLPRATDNGGRGCVASAVSRFGIEAAPRFCEFSMLMFRCVGVLRRETARSSGFGTCVRLLSIASSPELRVDMAQPMVVDNGSSVGIRAHNGPECLKIVFLDFQQKLVSAWQEEIAKELPSSLLELSNGTISVTTCQSYLESFLEANPVDCIVSPANSFGLMDGGLDLAISRYYGGVAKLVPVVRSAVVDEWCGQQNEGTCLLVDAQKLVQDAQQGEKAKNVPRYVAHVPTMRVPKHLQPDGDIAYRCTWALLTAVRKHNMQVAKQHGRRSEVAANGTTSHERINSVLCSGFGTGVGQFPSHECARQMVLAVKHFAERARKNSAEEDHLRGSSSGGLFTLWDEAEKIEDSVCCGHAVVPESL